MTTRDLKYETLARQSGINMPTGNGHNGSQTKGKVKKIISDSLVEKKVVFSLLKREYTPEEVMESCSTPELDLDSDLVENAINLWGERSQRLTVLKDRLEQRVKAKQEIFARLGENGGNSEISYVKLREPFIKPKEPWFKRHPILTALGTMAVLGAGAFVYKADNDFRNTPTIKYLVSQEIPRENARTLAGKLSLKLTENEKEFVEIVSAYSPELQRTCINSDILNKGTGGTITHVTDAELQAVREARQTGKVVNPKERYAFILHTPGYLDESLFSEANIREALKGVENWYRLFKEMGLSDDKINLWINNPFNISLGSDIKVDGVASRKSFLNVLERRISDSNDELYVILSKPNPNQEVRNQNYLGLEDGWITGGDLMQNLSIETRLLEDGTYGFNYGRVVIIGQLYGSTNMLENILVQGRVEKGLTTGYMNNSLAVVSPSNTTLDIIANAVRRNVGASFKELVEEHNKMYPGNGQAVAVHYDKQRATPAEESSRYDQPLFQ